MNASENIPAFSKLPTQPPAPPPYEKIHNVMISDRASKAGHNYANFFDWLVLAGYVMLPNTSLEESKDLRLFSGALCFIGIVGTCWLWHRWRKDPAWLL